MKKYIFFSIFLHLLPLIFFILGGKGSYQDAENQNIVPPTVELVSEQELKSIGDVPAPSKMETPKRNDCLLWFGGIGVSHHGGIVIDVYKGYPASKHGVLKNDLILNPDELRGEEGTEVQVVLKRDGHTIVLNMMREKICYVTEK